jgi:fumarate reductase flavoprotein subunit
MNSEATTKNLESELVIIGGGGAGLAAAVTAAENGIRRIIVLEKRARPGGNTARATGLFACESPAQKRQRIKADRDELFKRAMDWAHWSKINPRILRAFINKSGDTIRWLEEKGLEFDVIAFFPNQNPRVEHVPKGRGAELIRVLVEQCQELGVQLLPRTAGKRILRSADGAVSGVLAMSKEEFIITTRSVIITAGGFGGSKRLLKKYCPDYYDGMPLRGLPLTGDGLIMAAEAGAAVEDPVTLLKEGPRIDLNTWPVRGLEREPQAVWVNKNGERFADEATGAHPFESVNAILRQPGKVSYTLLDAAIRSNHEIVMPEVEQALQAETKKGRCFISDSWEDIARWIEADPDTLKETIDNYNRYCNQGYDEVFAKDRRYLRSLHTAPFYALKCLPHFLDTLGGIRINEHMQVLDSNEKPIPGLFAAGVITSGWESETYCSDLSGSAFGYAINSGRIAGEEACKLNRR